MGVLKRVVGIALVLVALAFGVLFSLRNSQVVPLDLLVIQLPEGPVAAWVLGAFVVGGLAGLVISSVALMRQKSRTLLLSRRIDKLNRELDGVRSADLRKLSTQPRNKGQAKG